MVSSLFCFYIDDSGTLRLFVSGLQPVLYCCNKDDTRQFVLFFSFFFFGEIVSLFLTCRMCRQLNSNLFLQKK